MTKNSYFGERALLFDEPRTATVEVWTREPGKVDRKLSQHGDELM